MEHFGANVLTAFTVMVKIARNRMHAKENLATSSQSVETCVTAPLSASVSLLTWVTVCIAERETHAWTNLAMRWRNAKVSETHTNANVYPAIKEMGNFATKKGRAKTIYATNTPDVFQSELIYVGTFASV